MALKTYAIYTRCEHCGVYDRHPHWCELCGRPKDARRAPPVPETSAPVLAGRAANPPSKRRYAG